MLVRSAAITTAAVVAGFVGASTAPAQGADAVIDGTYRIDFDGAHRMINGAVSPTSDTSASYSFTPSCTDAGCVVRGVLLSTTDKEAVSAHNPTVTLEFLDGAWKLTLPYESNCENNDLRNQVLAWTLTPQSGADVLTGNRTVATLQPCAGDDPGPLSQPMTATRVGKVAPGVAPMP